jgi:hypothetical protein
MSSRYDRVKKSYDYFVAKFESQEPFALADLAEVVGWSQGTVQSYVAKKWKTILRKADDEYFVRKIPFTKEQYLRFMSQVYEKSSHPKKPNLYEEIERLVIKARESALLSVDIYNRPVTVFRTEGYIVMMIIAWTALFHAIFTQQGKEYFYRDPDTNKPILIDGDSKAWDLRTCLKEYYGDSNNPARKNLEFFIGLRNKIEHRFAPAIEPFVMGECQAMLLNFDRILVEQFGEYYAIKEELVMPLQTSTLRSTSQYEAIREYQGKQYQEIREYIEDFRSGLSDTIFTDPAFSFRVYLIPKIGNHRTSSDLALEFIKYAPESEEFLNNVEKRVALIREKKVPVVNPGKFKPGQVAKIVSKEIDRPFSIHNHTQAWKYYGVRSKDNCPNECNIEYCQYDVAHQDFVYTMEWIDFLVNKLTDRKEYDKVVTYRWWKNV